MSVSDAPLHLLKPTLLQPHESHRHHRHYHHSTGSIPGLQQSNTIGSTTTHPCDSSFRVSESTTFDFVPNRDAAAAAEHHHHRSASLSYISVRMDPFESSSSSSSSLINFKSIGVSVPVPVIDDESPSPDCASSIVSSLTSSSSLSSNSSLSDPLLISKGSLRRTRCGSFSCAPASAPSSCCSQKLTATRVCVIISVIFGSVLGSIVLFLLTMLTVESVMYPQSSCSNTAFPLTNSNSSNLLLPNATTDLIQSSYISPSVKLSNYSYPLRLNHVRVLGTHNSYHKSSRFRPKIAAHQYNHASLLYQLNNGVRHLEIDIHPTSSGFRVFHLSFLDDQSTCTCLSECLAIIHSWSRRNPSHMPVTILIELKIAPYEDIRASLYGVSCDLLQRVENEILAVFDPTKIITPKNIQGGYSSLREAVNQQRKMERDGIMDKDRMDGGWPLLSESRGKVMFGWLDDVHAWGSRMKCAYTPSSSKVMFLVESLPNANHAALTTFPDPDSMNDKILDAVQNGLIVRTLTDKNGIPNPQLYGRSLTSGAQVVSTDFEQCEDETPTGSNDSYLHVGAQHNTNGYYCERLASGMPVECSIIGPADCEKQLREAYQIGML